MSASVLFDPSSFAVSPIATAAAAPAFATGFWFAAALALTAALTSALLSFPSLTTNLGELSEKIRRMFLNDPKRISTWNGRMLAGITRQDNATVLRQLEKPFHVIDAHGPSFVQHDDRIRRNVLSTLDQQTLERDGFCKSFLPQN